VDQPYSSTQGAVGFDITPIESASWQWSASYSSAGKTARFRIDLETESQRHAQQFSQGLGHGKFIREPDSDPEDFLVAIAKALEAKHLPKNVHKIQDVPFRYVIIGTDLSRASDGGLNGSPKGNWMAVKIFISDDDEVFMNLNPVLRKGEFSIKDPKYGDHVLDELARVL